MYFAENLKCLYFNYFYNPAYDVATARLACYHRLQRACIGKFEFSDGDRILCVGLGTGNEIQQIHKASTRVKIIGVDYSSYALKRSSHKASKLGKNIELHIMDIRSLQFPAESFDKVLCIHVMDFIDNTAQATREIIRVLRSGGQFVITYPSGKEGASMGRDVFRDNMSQYINSGKHKVTAFLLTMAQFMLGLVYLPLFLRPNKKLYSRTDLESMMESLHKGTFQIEEDPVYRDFIICGRKQPLKGEPNAS